MRIWMWAALAAVVTTNLAPAAEPWNLPQVRSSPPKANGLFTGAAVRAAAWRQEAPPAPARPPAIAGHGGIGIGSGNGAVATAGGSAYDGATISQTAWNNEHVYTGYVFGPGSCDYTPPCVDHLWDGYCQRPLRCGHHHGLFNHCGRCGGVSSGCSTCGQNYGSCGGGGCHGCRLHAGRHHGNCGCAVSCNTCGDSCNSGCGIGHFGKHVRAKCCGWFNSLCNACDGGMSCGCAAPIGNGGAGAETVPSPAPDAPNPPAAPDDGKSAMRGLNRFVPWSLK